MMDQPSRPSIPPASAGSVRQRRSWQAMATQFELELIGSDRQHLEAVAVAIEEEVRRLDQLLSRHDRASEISRINCGAAVGPLKVDADVWAIARRLRKIPPRHRGILRHHGRGAQRHAAGRIVGRRLAAAAAGRRSADGPVLLDRRGD